MSRAINKPKFTLITIMIKIICWLLFFAGIPIIFIGIYKIIQASLNFSTINNIFDDPKLALYSNKSVLLSNISTISEKIDEVKNSLQLITIGLLIILIARIISKPLIIGSSLFIFSVATKEAKSKAKLSFILNAIFLSISCIAIILILKASNDISWNFESTIMKEQEYLDSNTTIIKGLTEENYSVNIQNMSKDLQNHFPDFINSIPTIILNQTSSFIWIAVSLGVWIVTELIHFITWIIMKNN